MAIGGISGAGASETARRSGAAARGDAGSFSKLLQAVVPGGGSTADAAQALAVASGVENSAATDTLRRGAENLLSEFRRELQQILSPADIDTSTEIRLESDGQGGIRVANDHPDRDKIDQILKDNPDLAAKFQTLATSFRQLRDTTEGTAAGEPLFSPVFGVSLIDGEARASFE